MLKQIPLQIAASGPDTDWANIMEAIFIAITNAEDIFILQHHILFQMMKLLRQFKLRLEVDIDVKLLIPKIQIRG